MSSFGYTVVFFVSNDDRISSGSSSGVGASKSVIKPSYISYMLHASNFDLQTIFLLTFMLCWVSIYVAIKGWGNFK